MILYHIYWWLWILKNKINMIDMFNFYNKNWNLCWIEYPSLRSKILIKNFLKKRQPNLSYFWTWDCLDYIWILDPKRVELTSRAYECVFFRYAINNETYKFYDLNVKVIIDLKDVNFYVNIYPFNLRILGALVGALVRARH